MKITEENYLRRLKKHDEKALFYVIDMYGGLIKSIVCHHLYLLREEQEECIDDILFAIWNNIEYFDEEKGTFSNWIAGVAKYKAIDRLRRYSRHAVCENIEEIDISHPEDMVEQILEKEVSEELEKMLRCLKEQDREIFLKLFYEEKNVDEVSRETGIDKPVLYNRISRGKKKIRRSYLERGETDEKHL